MASPRPMEAFPTLDDGAGDIAGQSVAGAGKLRSLEPAGVLCLLPCQAETVSFRCHPDCAVPVFEQVSDV